MGAGSDAVVVAAVALVVTTASFTAFGRHQIHPRGWRWWVAGLWLTTAGVVAAAIGPALTLPATLLLLAWPITTLVGLRRFHARIRLPLDERADWAVLAVAGALAASAPWWQGEVGVAAVPASAAAFVHLYAACLLLSGPGGRDGVPLLVLGATLALVALAPLPAGWAGYEGSAPIGLRAIAATLGALVMAFVVLTLVGARTERQLRASHRRLRDLGRIDGPTTVPDSGVFDALAERALRRALPGTPALLLFEVDHVGLIVETFGHPTAERVRRLVLAVSRELLRAQDIADRRGADGFAVLLAGMRVQDAGRVAARIVERVQSEAAALALPTPTLSFGMVQCAPAETLAGAVRRAERALAEAQRKGRACAVVALGGESRPIFGESQPLGLPAV